MPLDQVASDHPVSPSQIETWELCPRKWAYDKVERIPRGRNKYADRGNAVHSVAENWLEHGIAIDFGTDVGKILSAGVKHLPLPKTGLIEHDFWLTTDTALYRGKWDRWKPIETHPELHAYKTTIHDHKSTSSFTWLKDFELLRSNVQANIYAVAALKAASLPNLHALDPLAQLPPHQIDPTQIVADLNWVYYLANPQKPASRRVNLVVLPNDMTQLPERPEKVRAEHFGVIRQSELEENWNQIEETADQMLNVFRQGARASDLPPGPAEACEAYGGCPYRNNPCKLTMSQIIRGKMEQTTAVEKIRAQLAARKAASAAAGAGAAPANGAAPAPADKPTETKSIAVKLAAAKPLAAKPEAKTAVEVQAAPPAVNPPEENLNEDGSILIEASAPAAAVPTRSPAEGDLRDQFAIQIAAALIGCRLYSHRDPNFAEAIAHESYDLADTMLRVRTK